jgi:microcystin-dependent protein
MKKAMKKTETNMDTTIAQGDFPIGTIIPFAGTLNIASIESQGWLYCNGNSISRTDYATLFAVIGAAYGGGDLQTTFDLPDFRGTFMRGVTGSTNNDPEAASRKAAASGGNTGNNIGSVQNFATGVPATALVTNTTGAHTHTIAHIPTDNSSYAIAGSYQAIWNDGSGNTDDAGDHTHTVNGGGDKESRSINVYTYFLIRFI